MRGCPVAGGDFHPFGDNEKEKKMGTTTWQELDGERSSEGLATTVFLETEEGSRSSLGMSEAEREMLIDLALSGEMPFTA